MKCRHCNQEIIWDWYWTTWDHTGRKVQLYAELCNPELGFEASKYARP